MKRAIKPLISFLIGIACFTLAVTADALRQAQFAQAYIIKQTMQVLPHFFISPALVYVLYAPADYFMLTNKRIRVFNAFVLVILISVLIFEIVRCKTLGADFRIFEFISSSCGAFVSMFVYSITFLKPTNQRLIGWKNE